MDTKRLKRIGTKVAAGAMIGVVALTAGCVQKVPVNDLSLNSVNPAVQKLVSDAKAADNGAVAEEAVNAYLSAHPELIDATGKVVYSEADAKVLEDAKNIADELKLKELAAKKELDFEQSGKSFSIALGAPVGEAILDHTDMSSLKDAKLSFRGEDYDFHEELVVSPDVQVVVNSIPGADKLFAEPHVIFGDDGAISYSVVVDDEFEDDIDVAHPLNLPFLNDVLSIARWDESSIKVANGLEFNVDMSQGNLVKFEEKEFKVDVFADGKVRVALGGAGVTVEEGDTAELGEYSIFVREVCYDEREAGHDLVTLRIAGKDAIKEIENGDEYEPNDKFEWVVSSNSVGLRYVDNFDEKDEGALAVGESFDFLGKFKLVNAGFDENVKYGKFVFSPKEVEDKATFKVEGFSDDSIELDGEEYKEVFVRPDGTFYKNDDGDYVFLNGEYPTLVNGDKEVELEWTEDGEYMLLGKLAAHVGYNVEDNELFLGDEQEESEKNELLLDEFGISDKDQEDWMALDGSKVKVEEDKDKFTLELANEDDVEQKVVIGSQ